MEDTGQGAKPNSPQNGHRRYATERWVEAVFRGAQSPEDPKTIVAWARLVGTSRSALSTLCRAAGISPRDSRDFTRLLRAFVVTDGGSRMELHDVLDIVEPKTAERLFTRAGLQQPAPQSPLEFLDRQRLVRNPHALSTMRTWVQQLIDRE